MVGSKDKLQFNMKKIFLLMMLLATVFVACSDDDDDNKKEGDNETPWEIKMTVKVDADNVEFITSLEIKGDKKTVAETVDWGDGSTISENLENLKHYYNAGTYSITIKGKGEITRLICSPSSKWYITVLDVTKCTTLSILRCGNNQLTSLDVSKCTELTELSCDENLLTSLDISKCSKLQNLNCGSNQLTSLDVSKCTELVKLECYGNKLASLNVTTCSKLNFLWCYNNKLTALDVTGCTKIYSIDCSNNKFDDNAMNAFYNSLPDRTKETSKGYISLNENDAKGNTTITLNKNWEITLK